MAKPQDFKIFATDIDGTLTNYVSSWQALHEYFGCQDGAEENYQKYNGVLTGNSSIMGDHRDWMVADCDLWIKASDGAVNRNMLEKFFCKMNLRPHAKEVLGAIKQKYKIYLVTQAVDACADVVARKIGLPAERVLTDRFLYDNNGKIIGVDKNNLYMDKGGVLRHIAETEGVSTLEIITFGDTNFDQPMFELSGLSIAINNGNNSYMRDCADHYINNIRELKHILL